ncbi:Phage P2 capsid completion gpL-like protein [Azotobacter vinelandii CA]|uniref:Phage P2 capsid completion gpL-like protein n=2 Tax=Azotobacter vinelandii TaxID=354 RepID=C1DS26_AZOVD|nr:head completion/stabilization protein [Azotobacter vinelandii]ACO79901.1 Phage P2 capsid completion gpL-like protein [Azotobacter vinelandii DJ]AGK13653.1 Phage P2 capsid completion gpL-like protein [Azotobacter vinelandii CA]AGK18175.1 Phage P2 capsid completion gpL-like protein [Azotobacter vinelandii CA6]SFX44793.1 Phage head completion protein (GPL) [Azotobacter vinelandii]GLK62289.1 phage capsid completion protein [Azotobacter vinelandii]
MSGFIANGGTVEPFVLDNDGWFPDIDAEHLRAAVRMDGSITNARLEVAAVAAMLSVNRELAAYKAAELANGYAALADVPAVAIDGESERVHLYRRAVYCSAGAELAERYRSYDATAAGNQRADDLTPSIDEFRRDARWAIRDLLGVTHTTVELI